MKEKGKEKEKMDKNQFFVVLPSNSSMEVFPDNKTASYKVILPEELQLDRERFEVGLSEIQFPVTWYNIRNGRNIIKKTIRDITIEEKKLTLPVDHSIVEDGEKTTSSGIYSLSYDISIPAGHYSSPQEIIDILEMQEKHHPRPIRFKYDKISRRVTIKLEKECTVKMEKSDVSRCLGFHAVEISTKAAFKSQSFTSESIASIQSINSSVYVYTNIIENQHTGNFKVPLLRVVPVRSSYAELCCVSYDRPHFVSLSQSNIQTIEIDLRYDTGELISFETGKVVVTLLFKRKQTRFYY